MDRTIGTGDPEPVVMGRLPEAFVSSLGPKLRYAPTLAFPPIQPTHFVRGVQKVDIRLAKAESGPFFWGGGRQVQSAVAV